jgi:cytosine/adenosine deaminase-related metal-dependent hydrolase
MKQCMTRRDYAGGTDPDRQPLPKERLRLDQALAAYTLNGARQLGISDEVGSLEVGKKADLVIVSRDPLSACASNPCRGGERSGLGRRAGSRCPALTQRPLPAHKGHSSDSCAVIELE